MHIVFHISVFGSNFRIRNVSVTGSKFLVGVAGTPLPDPRFPFWRSPLIPGIIVILICFMRIKFRNPLKFAGRIMDQMKVNALSKPSITATTEITTAEITTTAMTTSETTAAAITAAETTAAATTAAETTTAGAGDGG